MQDLYEIKKELINFFRSQDIINTSNRGVTRATETFSGDNSETEFTLTNTPVHNIVSISISGTSKSYGTDYTFNESTGKVTFTSAPATGTDNISIQYDYGTTDSIFPDFPQENLKLSAFPRIAVEVLDSEITDIDLGAQTTNHSYIITIVCYSTTVEELEDMISDVQNVILQNKKTFYYLKYIKPIRLGPVINSPGKSDKVIARNIDLRSDFNYEVVA